jgi:signal peptidase I
MGSLLILLFPFISFFQVTEVSMEPVLHDGDIIPVIRTDDIKKGDLVVFTTPEDKLAVKSCYLTEGDPVRLKGNYLMAGGKLWFLQPDQKEVFSHYTKVPEGTLLLLGENSFHSRDSREWGFIKKNVILGKVIGRKGKIIE